MTSLRRRFAATLALSATAALFPLLALAGPADAGAGPDCSAEQAAAATAAQARADAHADWSSYVGGEYATAAGNLAESRIAKNARLAERADAVADEQAARAAYDADPSESNEQALAEAAEALQVAKQAVAPAWELFRANRTTLAEAKVTRAEKAALRNSTRVTAVALRNAAAACPTTKPYATVGNLRTDGGAVYGDVTFRNIPSNGAYQITNIAAGCSSYGCGQWSTGGGSERSLGDQYIGTCTSPVDEFRFFNIYDASLVFARSADFSAACVV